MRPSIIAGTIIAAAGAIILLRGLSYQSTHEVMHVGDVKVTDTDSHRIPQWVGIAAVVAGLGVIGAGASKRI
jgi:hypothetical protein